MAASTLARSGSNPVTATMLNNDAPQSFAHLNTSGETEPLLANPATSRRRHRPRRWQPQSSWGIISLLYAIVFLLQFGGKLMVVPTTRFLEFILCHYHYNQLEGDKHVGFEDDLPEAMCKGQAVQEKLNVLMAMLWVLSCIPALATTVAYGSLADRWGRRPIFALAMVGLIMASMFNISIIASWRWLPLQLIWISPVFFLIGGGEAVANMMFFAMANDITPESNRSTVFLLGGAGALIAEIVAPSLSSFLMLTSLWLPIIIGMVCLILGTALLIFVPETLHLSTTTPDAVETSSLEDEDSPKIDNTNLFTAVRSRYAAFYKRVHASTKMLHSVPIILLLITFLVGPFGRVAGDMFLRYVSNRFHWDLREVGFLLSLQAFVNLILVVGVLPGTSYILTTYFNYSIGSKDLLLAQISIILLTVGAMLTAAAPTIATAIVGLVCWTFGTGYPALARSLVTTLVDPQHVGRLFAVIAIIEILCYMAAGPLQASLYHLGLQWGGVWQGLPYFSLGVVYGIAAISLFGFRWLESRKSREDTSDSLL